MDKKERGCIKVGKDTSGGAGGTSEIHIKV